MPKHRLHRLIAVAAAVAVLITSIQLGFADAWRDGYALPASAEIADEIGAGIARPTPDPKPEPSARPAADPDAGGPLKPQPVALSNRVTEYHISVKLEEGGVLTGSQTVTWKNPGRKPVSDLYLHLYPNAFSPGSTFLRESGGRLRGDRMPAGGSGSMELTALATEQGETLLPRLRYVQPDDRNAADRTLAGFRLPEPVKPGESVTLKMSFTVHLPPVFARMGQAGDFVMAGQWFPKLAVYEPAGMRGRTTEGWNLHQYHGDSEFYSDFGIYSVKIDVPESHIVAATGFQTKPATLKNGRKTYQYYADDVHDFAWAASPDFHFVEQSYSSASVPGVRIKLYLDPLHKDLQERYLHAAKSALTLLGKWYGEYPYATLTIVVPPAAANGAGGMEYPTLVTGDAAKEANPGYNLERTLVHEIAHQYWYGMIATNEFEEAWLDEGFASYTEDKLMTAIYGVVTQAPIEASYLTHPEPLRRFSWQYASSDRYAENVYMRAKLVLTAMERQIGEKKMNAILRTYFQKYRFKHPTAADFRKVAESVTKRSWGDFFEAYVDRGEMADFAVESIASVRQEDGAYVTRVELRRHSGRPEPVQLLLRFADGSSVRQTWDGVQNHELFEVKHDSPLLYAAVDPSLSVVLDNRRYNNYLKAEVPMPSRTRWSVGVSQVVEGLLGLLAW